MPVSQWILIKDYKLSTDDAVRFPGGDGTDLIRQAMVLYLKKDKERFRQHYEKLQNDDNYSLARFVLITYLRNDILEVPVPKEQPDLKPAKAETITQAVLECLEER